MMKRDKNFMRSYRYRGFDLVPIYPGWEISVNNTNPWNEGCDPPIRFSLRAAKELIDLVLAGEISPLLLHG